MELTGETTAQFGAAELVTVVEASGGDVETQTAAYADLCAVLDARLKVGARQVLGCLVIEGSPDPDAFLTGLDHMLRADGTFTPVLPLSIDQAAQIVNSGSTLLDVVDPATALIEVAASRKPPTHDAATTALEEIEELISRETEA